MKRKLQVFVSSTYSDLIHERQFCVEAILRAGHIPAGMELFSAGSETQLDIIKRWIDESDVYMLLLGGRYGSIEPVSGLSYTEIEYNYAIEIGKPFFAIVLSDDFIDEKVDKKGRSILELDNGALFKKFRNYALTKISKIVKTNDEIKLTVLESLFDIQNRLDLKGWVKEADLTDFRILLNRNQELVERNLLLEKLLEESKLREKKIDESDYNGYSFNNLKDYLKSIEVDITQWGEISKELGNKVNAFDLILRFSDILVLGFDGNDSNNSYEENFCMYNVVPKLITFGLANVVASKLRNKIYKLNDKGIRFIGELAIDKLNNEMK
jgi:Domain of unknown function (DUF4062)